MATYTDAMTAHGHLFSRPSICTIDQQPLVGTTREWCKVSVLIDAYWTECEQCKPGAVRSVAADAGAFLALWRVCILQETGVLRRPFGSAEADAERERLGQFEPVVMRKLVDAGARMWVNRARLFDQISDLGEGEDRGRLLQRPETKQPGPHH